MCGSPQCFCCSFSGLCNFGDSRGQVQTEQAVTAMMPQHHHSGAGAPVQENSALIVFAADPSSVACLKAHWPMLVLNLSVHLANLHASHIFYFASSFEGFLTLYYTMRIKCSCHLLFVFNFSG